VRNATNFPGRWSRLADFPSFGEAVRIEWRAGRIADPVKRLRYLRRRMLQTKRRGFHGWGLIAVPLMIAVAAARLPSGSAETMERERGLAVPRAAGAAPSMPPQVWLIEKTEAEEVYSNGLRVDRTFLTANRPRARFPVYSLAGSPVPWRYGGAPVGIVYHTTESLVPPFEEDQNRRLQRLGRNLLEVVRSERAYHFVIDRFGRVYAVVAETDAANHAGNSIWADGEEIYVNLNDSFLGVALEAQTGAAEAVTPAQIQAAKVLTEALRFRYRIPAENCVTHAQVSVNPLNMKVGAHTDWAGDFPFAKLGLPDNYSIPLPSIYAFGFEADPAYERALGMNFGGVALARAQIERQAAAQNTPAAQYRAMLRHRYRDIEAELKQNEGGN